MMFGYGGRWTIEFGDLIRFAVVMAFWIATLKALTLSKTDRPGRPADHPSMLGIEPTNREDDEEERGGDVIYDLQRLYEFYDVDYEYRFDSNPDEYRTPDTATGRNDDRPGGTEGTVGSEEAGANVTDSGLGKTKTRQQLPQAIIIGVKKGGTRALLEFLRVHPDIRAPGPEMHFFDRYYDRGLEWYRNMMPVTSDSQVTIEKTPSYFVTKAAPGRVFNMSKEARLIIVVRDPVTRAISDYTQVATKRRDLRSFEQMAFLDNATGPVATSWGAIKIGLYAKHLERWLQFFSLSQLHFVNGERLIENPAAELARLQDFLGLSRFITDKHFYFDAAKGFPCLKKSDRTGSPHCLGKTKGRLHPDVDEKVLQRLRNFYRPFNEKFYEMTGINFGWP